MPDDPKAKHVEQYRRWVKDVYEPWYAAMLSGNNGPPPPPPGDGG